MSKLYVFLFLLLCACSIPSELPPDNQPTEPTPEAPEVPQSPTCEESPESPAPTDDELNILELPAERCAGHWADNSDSSTRFTSHPDTGLCTFACVWEDPRCKEAWFGDPRCFPAHAAVLGETCANIGGTCQLNEARTNRYCIFNESAL
jgi:hypothetical protein